MTDLRETVARAQFRHIVQKHGDEWVVFDRQEQLALENFGEQLAALERTKELNADAAIVAVLEPTREWVAKHREAANTCATNPHKLLVGTVDNHVGAASACEEILMHIDALIAQHKQGETK